MAKEILIADSDKADQEGFKKIFESTDYNLVFSESGEHALLRLKLFKPDLIIAGASLKEKSGLEVCKAIKTDPELKHIPVILLSNIFKDISAEDRKRVKADGIITKPFHEDEILNLVDRLIQEEEIKTKKEGVIGREMEWKSIADIGKMDSGKKEEFLLDEVVEAEEEEIIDLVDVVEEPEMKLSIHDFVAPEKEAPFPKTTPLESWEKLMEEEKPTDRRFKFAPDEKEREAKGLPLQLDEELNLREEASEKELFDKIELEEILQKVEQLAPSIEKEWPPEVRKKGAEAPEAVLPIIEEPPEKYTGLTEFEAALKREVGAEPLEEEAQPFFIEKPKKEALEEFAPAEVSLEEELKEVGKEEFPEFLLEVLEEEEVRGIEELKEERIEIVEEAGVPEVEKEEIRIIEEPEEERIEMFEEVTAPEVTTPIIQREEIIPPSRAVERQMEEVISKGALEIMEGFITKLVPEMTQSIINLTIERIERMVKEIVPELAEKMIQEEIKRLKKGEKD